MTVFNANNTDWQNKQGGELFLGQPLALHDTVNVRYPQLATLSQRAVSQRWVFDEFNHEQSRLDLTTCPKNVYDVMLMNLAYQWEADSVASRAIAPMFAPFVTNSELWELMLENTNMEVTHAKTYSEIVRQCVPNPADVFKMVMQNDQTIQRASTVNQVFEDLEFAGAMHVFRARNMPGYKQFDDNLFYTAVMGAMWALYGLERTQFMSSFSATFAIVETGDFQSIGKAVQKIMLDELFVHAAMDRAVLKIEMATDRGKAWMKQNRESIKKMLDDITRQELQWAPYLLGEGRSIVGYTVPLATAWTMWNAKECYELAGVDAEFDIPSINPLPWMENWINIDKTQNAMQEGDGNNYALNVVKDDLGDEELDF